MLLRGLPDEPLFQEPNEKGLPCRGRPCRLGIYARRSELLHAGVRIPVSPQDAWSRREFNGALERLARADADGAVLDLKLNRDERWLVDAILPLIQSVGVNLVNRDHQITVQGKLNSEEVVTALQLLQDWKRRGFIEKDRDDDAFVKRG